MDSYYDLEDPSDWPAALPHLRELDQLFRCPVCKEYLDAPMVVTNCGHTFCSLCVRRCLTQETKCPSCRAPTTESELHPNRLVESLLREFRRGRPQLLSTIKAASKSQSAVGRKRPRVSDSPKRHDELPSAELSNKSSTHVDLTASDIEDMNGLSDMEMDGDESKHESASANDTDSDFVPETGSRGATKRNSGKPSPRKATTASVACPNCQQNVRQARINWHLDRCLAGLSTDDPLPAPATVAANTRSAAPATSTTTATAKLQLPVLLSNKFSLPRPTKLAYSLLSEAKLRRTLRDLGIPSKGDKHQMQMRHVEWVNMYMANADSAFPVSHRVLLKRLSAWEDALGRHSDAPKAQTLSSQGDVAEHASKYADAFADLVTQAGSNRKKSAANTPT
ncbi:E3 ubiquitin-protein ligase rad18 [Coemansia interrupta]|uniref:Postreplication repair E3 ubiquitin-protein ligase RAD18 n=1 Tax=Coemansia interrupta TaxID=1126814 RepID=A0A9W8LHW2_9FUNG|nr:E3 ubiquitin-protein ligase rad18 [Coemansia interrupta]